MTEKAKVIKKQKPLAVAINMKAASASWDVPITVLRAAKAEGCDAFHLSGRIDRKKFLVWLNANYDKAESAKEHDMSLQDKTELEKEKLKAQIIQIRSRNDRESSNVIACNQVKMEWARCIAIVQEEARNLINDDDKYRIFCERIQARIGEE